MGAMVYGLALFGLLPALACATETPFAGRWSGRAHTADETTRIELDVVCEERRCRARMNLLDVGVRGWPAEYVEARADRLAVVVRADSGPQTLSLRYEDERISGEWRAPGYDEVATVSLDRIQALEDVPEERVAIVGPAGSLGASVILPEGDGPFPGVVFLHGSGPQLRDANRWAAQELSRYGIASVVYDKRGVGESEGDFVGASLEDLARDGMAVAEYLLKSAAVSAVGFAGHSQGGWIGPLAGCLWPATAFVISSAGPAVPPSRETHWPVIRAMRANGASPADEAVARHLFDLWHEGIRSGDWYPFDQAFANAQREPWFDSSGIAWLEGRPDGDAIRTYRAMMDYDPIPVLRSLEVPLLALLSPDDESIDAVETEGILRALVGTGRNIEIRTYPGYSHGMRRLGARWPSLPDDYYRHQADFIKRSVGTSERSDFRRD
jgi:dienelactone hydrolase